MSLAIYRKYRPQNWSDLTGQNHIKVTLQNEIASGKLAHAFIFTGPRGIGKTTTARLLAKSLNCEQRKEGESEPCNVCDSCTELVGGQDLDILEIDAASHTGVDHVRENIIANARFTPVKRKYKVFIIDEVHMLSISAFNALLKILEEPPAHAIFILATTEIHKVPATIISRCQRFDFKKINSKDLIKRLAYIGQEEGVKINKEVLSEISRFSEGCLRDAESLLGQVLSLGEKEVTADEASLIIPATNQISVLELLRFLVLKDVNQSIALINELAEEGVDLLKFTDDLIESLRKIILNKVSGSLKEYAFELDQESENAIIDLSQKFTEKELLLLINIFSSKKNEIKTAVIAQLPLEIAVIEYCQNNQDNSDDSPNQDEKTELSDDNKKSESEKNDPPNAEDPEKISKAESVSNDTLKTCKIESETKKKKNVNLKIEEIKNKWHQFIVKMQEENASLVFILKVSEPLDLNGNVLNLGLKYDFHQQRLNQSKVKETFEENLTQFFNQELVLETCLLPSDYESDFIKEQTKDDEVELVDEISAEDVGEEQKEMLDNLMTALNGKVSE